MIEKRKEEEFLTKYDTFEAFQQGEFIKLIPELKCKKCNRFSIVLHQMQDGSEMYCEICNEHVYSDFAVVDVAPQKSPEIITISSWDWQSRDPQNPILYFFVKGQRVELKLDLFDLQILKEDMCNILRVRK